MKPPHRSLTVYYGALSLHSCHGKAVQERVFLMNDGTCAAKDGGHTLRGHRRNKEHGLVGRSFCVVNVTTVFIPHTVRERLLQLPEIGSSP